MLGMIFLSFISFSFTKKLSKGDSKLDLKNIPLVMSTDEKYVRPTVVVLTSLFENSNPTTFYEVSILFSGGLKLEEREKIGFLKGKYKNCRIDFIDMGDKYENLSSRTFPAAAYYRMNAAEIFPNLEKCIYMDGDVIVKHDLSELYDTNIDDYYVGGVHDQRLFTLKPNYFKVLNMPDLEQYINTGVLVMNLKKIREDGMQEKFSTLAAAKTEKMLYADQDIINPACYGKILFLPLKFNVMITLFNLNESYEKSDFAKRYSTPVEWKEAQEDPVIVHFPYHKPWTSPEWTVQGGFVGYHREWTAYDKAIAKSREDRRRLQKQDRIERILFLGLFALLVAVALWYGNKEFLKKLEEGRNRYR